MDNLFQKIKDMFEYGKWKKDIYYQNLKLDYGDYDEETATAKKLNSEVETLFIPNHCYRDENRYSYSPGFTSSYNRRYKRVNKVELSDSIYLAKVKKIYIGFHAASFIIKGKTTKLQKIELAPNNSFLEVNQEVLYDKNMSTLILYPSDKSEEEFIIPNKVEKIQSYAFYDSNNLKKIVFNNKKIIIEEFAIDPIEKFDYDFVSLLNMNEQNNTVTIEKLDDSAIEFLNKCTKKDVTINIPEKYNDKIIEKIGDGAFANIKTLRKIYIPKTIKHIEYNSFQDCDSLNEVVIDENNPYFKYDNGIIYTKDGKTIVSVVNSVVSSLEEVHLLSSVNDYDNLLKIQNVTVNRIVIENNDYLKTIDGVLYSKNGELLFKYPSNFNKELFECPEGVKVIYNYAFENSKWLKEVRLPSSVKGIGDQAFKNCVNLENINIPKEVDVLGLIENNVFENCPYVQMKYEAKFSDDLVYKYDDNTDSYICVGYKNCSDKHIIIPPVYNGKRVYKVDCNERVLNNQVEILEFSKGIKVLNISLNPYNEKYNIKTINIPSTVDNINISCYRCEELTNINVSTDNSCYKSVEGVLYTKDNKKILAYPAGKTDKLYTIIDGVETIEQNVFAQNKTLVRVVMPNSVTEIKNRAFEHMESLNAVYLSEKIEEIGNYAFAFCRKLNYINLSDKLNLGIIGEAAFQECPIIECEFDSYNYKEYFYNTEIDESKIYTVNTQKVSGFYEFELAVIVFKDKLKYIGKSAFEGSPFIYAVEQDSYYKPKSTLIIEEYAFKNCMLYSVKLHGNLEIKDNAFESAFEIDKKYDLGGCIFFYDGYPVISNTAFKYCDCIKIYFHEDEPYINEYKFVIRIGEEAMIYWNVDEFEI